MCDNQMVSQKQLIPLSVSLFLSALHFQSDFLQINVIHHFFLKSKFRAQRHVRTFTSSNSSQCVVFKWTSTHWQKECNNFSLASSSVYTEAKSSRSGRKNNPSRAIFLSLSPSKIQKTEQAIPPDRWICGRVVRQEWPLLAFPLYVVG